MPIPDADSAFVPPEKLSNYLLDLTHPVGGSKARWFLSLGYETTNPERLATDLLAVVHRSADFEQEETRFGTKYIVQGRLETPKGVLANVVTVWITEIAVSKPRLVTAYPGER
jgi:hypothetical protein